MPRMIDVNLRQVDDDTPAQVTYIIEQFRNDVWARKEAADVLSKTPEAQRSILLADNERLVIEPILRQEIIYDKDQSAARPLTPKEREQRDEEWRKRVEEEGALPPGEIPTPPPPSMPHETSLSGPPRQPPVVGPHAGVMASQQGVEQPEGAVEAGRPVQTGSDSRPAPATPAPPSQPKGAVASVRAPVQPQPSTKVPSSPPPSQPPKASPTSPTNQSTTSGAKAATTGSGTPTPQPRTDTGQGVRDSKDVKAE